MAIFSFGKKLRLRNVVVVVPGRKTKSLESNPDGTVKADGVFVSSRTLATRPVSPPSSDRSFSTTTSTSECRTVTTAKSTTTTSSSSSTTTTTTPVTSWKSSGTKDHHRNSPLLVSNPDHGQGAVAVVDEATELGKIVARSRRLPGTWYYSSNHVLVNQERSGHVVAPLIRMVELDRLARIHAEQIADEQTLRHIEPDILRWALKDIPHRRLGENVATGDTVRSIHNDMMNTLSNRNNILDRRFTHFGMGTALGENGELYLCQIFRG